ncbi:hypothetical protein [Neorhizobium galegae]|uniref:hypothetical protein n=1 Tax=Neorhizobium galegae TaxID=399 RepID=UPI001F36845B|nr:hypothetical protein [Neorhizobium galegae]UIK07966.1 hypothetical protein LZK81_26475 [Neorhizobium galegae]
MPPMNSSMVGARSRLPRHRRLLEHVDQGGILPGDEGFRLRRPLRIGAAGVADDSQAIVVLPLGSDGVEVIIESRLVMIERRHLAGDHRIPE